MANNSGKLLFNVGGAIAGVLLAAVAIFALVEQQSSATQPVKYSQNPTYGNSSGN